MREMALIVFTALHVTLQILYRIIANPTPGKRENEAFGSGDRAHRIFENEKSIIFVHDKPREVFHVNEQYPRLETGCCL
ncbi:hypothetical protein SAMN05216244_0470 [Sediminibacillus halophilus]|uniref:Uncharacterized protein n=1 Tax=Sediminibacillus halophilus TaxID=482461 RepID=A0A1G9M7G5_9BACI|nr:hypothetical protein SAMN05216244_0470 [Sediminibacillus halophilus]